MILYGHGAPGFMECNQSLFVANSGNTRTGQSYGLSECSAGSLSELELIVFAGCHTGVTDAGYGNLVDMARSKGAQIAIGWTDKIYEEYADSYFETFTAALTGQSVAAALAEADSWVDTNVERNRTLLLRYIGTSELNSVNLS